MLKGIGCDIIEVARIEASIARSGQPFLDKVFTEQEQAYCSRFKDSWRRYAGRFAAKESVVKAFKTGFGEHFSWKDIEIGNDENGAPFVVICPKLKAFLGQGSIHISISHDHNYATAMAVWENV